MECFGRTFKSYFEAKKAVKTAIIKKIEEGNFFYDGYFCQTKYPKFSNNGDILDSKTKNFVIKECKEDLDRVDEILLNVINNSEVSECFITMESESNSLRQEDAMEIKSTISCKETYGVNIYVKIFKAFSPTPTVVIHANDN